MSNPETFIEEVNEEVRRDALFAFLKKWGWVGVLAVILIVGGAAANEVMNARAERAAQANGDAILAAMETEDPAARLAALEAISAESDAAAVIQLIEAAEAQEPSKADAALAAIAGTTTYPPLYRDLATLKRVLLADGPMSAEDKIAALTPLAEGGAFRVLAEEQLAYAELAQSQNEAALERLQNLMIDAEAGDTVRQRISDLIVALGGDVDGQ